MAILESLLGKRMQDRELSRQQSDDERYRSLVTEFEALRQKFDADPKKANSVDLDSILDRLEATGRQFADLQADADTLRERRNQAKVHVTVEAKRAADEKARQALHQFGIDEAKREAEARKKRQELEEAAQTASREAIAAASVAAYLDSTGEEPAERVAIGEQLVALYRVRESLTQRLNPNAAPDIRKAPAALIKSLERELSNLPGPSHQRAAEIKAAIKGARGVVAELESELKRVEKQIAGLEAKSAELADVRRIPEHFKLSPPRATKS